MPSLLLDLEIQKNVVPGESNEVERRLSFARRLAGTGLFGLEDIVCEALGGASFIDGLKKHFYEVAKSNRRDHGNVYREFYIRFGTKHLKRLVSGTLGSVLFSYDGIKNPETWTTEDAKRASSYVYSRYQLVHDVIEGLANIKKNPMGSNLSKEQTIALMCKTLRAAIYPGYKMDNLARGIAAGKRNPRSNGLDGWVELTLDFRDLVIIINKVSFLVKTYSLITKCYG